ncbi:hypothetical protein PR048_021176 [Dryococelus australis]|uniref:Uncharacterized protein n=1 Tax=Dryococelus australis TaxID=614101 RepID=A0ABQ9GXG1_9NEOP|nr:hypothetical protein PR048_021176 [Dryococelus australis]
MENWECHEKTHQQLQLRLWLRARLKNKCPVRHSGRDVGLGKESAVAFVRDPSQHSPGVISENYGEKKKNQDGRTGNRIRVVQSVSPPGRRRRPGARFDDAGHVPWSGDAGLRWVIPVSVDVSRDLVQDRVAAGRDDAVLAGGSRRLPGRGTILRKVDGGSSSPPDAGTVLNRNAFHSLSPPFSHCVFTTDVVFRLARFVLTSSGTAFSLSVHERQYPHIPRHCIPHFTYTDQVRSSACDRRLQSTRTLTSGPTMTSGPTTSTHSMPSVVHSRSNTQRRKQGVAWLGGVEAERAADRGVRSNIPFSPLPAPSCTQMFPPATYGNKAAATQWAERSPSAKVNGVRAPGVLPAGIAPDDATGRRVFSGISSLLLPCIPVLLHIRLASPSSAPKTPMLTAAQTSPLNSRTATANISEDDILTSNSQFCALRHDGNTACLARMSDETLGVRVRVTHIAPSLLELGRAAPTNS